MRSVSRKHLLQIGLLSALLSCVATYGGLAVAALTTGKGIADVAAVPPDAAERPVGPDAFDARILQAYFQSSPGVGDGSVRRAVIIPTPEALLQIVGRAFTELRRMSVLLRDIPGSEDAVSVVASAMERLRQDDLDPLAVEHILADAVSVIADAFRRDADPAKPVQARPPQDVLEDIANMLQTTIPAIQSVYEQRGVPVTVPAQQAFEAARQGLLDSIMPCRANEPACGEAIEGVLEEMDALRDIMEADLRSSPDAEKIEAEIELLMPQSSMSSFMEPWEPELSAPAPAGVEYEDEVY